MAMSPTVSAVSSRFPRPSMAEIPFNVSSTVVKLARSRQLDLLKIHAHRLWRRLAVYPRAIPWVDPIRFGRLRGARYRSRANGFVNSRAVLFLCEVVNRLTVLRDVRVDVHN